MGTFPFDAGTPEEEYPNTEYEQEGASVTQPHVVAYVL